MAISCKKYILPWRGFVFIQTVDRMSVCSDEVSTLSCWYCTLCIVGLLLAVCTLTNSMLCAWEGKLSNSQFRAISHFSSSFVMSQVTCKSFCMLPIAITWNTESLFMNAKTLLYEVWGVSCYTPLLLSVYLTLTLALARLYRWSACLSTPFSVYV